MTLYEIDNAISQCIDWETGEITDLIYLEQLEMERSKKIENVALYCKELGHFSDSLEEEIENLRKRKKTADNAVKRLKSWLATACDAKKFETPKTRVSFRQTEETVIDNEELILKKYMTKKVTYTVSKTAIKDAILAGKKVKGAHIEKKWATTIK